MPRPGLQQRRSNAVPMRNSTMRPPRILAGRPSSQIPMPQEHQRHRRQRVAGSNCETRLGDQTAAASARSPAGFSAVRIARADASVAICSRRGNFLTRPHPPVIHSKRDRHQDGEGAAR